MTRRDFFSNVLKSLCALPLLGVRGKEVERLRKEASLGRAATRFYLDAWRQALDGINGSLENTTVDLEGNSVEEVKEYIIRTCNGNPQYFLGKPYTKAAHSDRGKA